MPVHTSSSKRFMPFYTSSKRFMPFHTSSKRFMPVHISSSKRFILVHTSSKWFMPVYTGSNQFTPVHMILLRFMAVQISTCWFMWVQIVWLPYYWGRLPTYWGIFLSDYATEADYHATETDSHATEADSHATECPAWPLSLYWWTEMNRSLSYFFFLHTIFALILNFKDTFFGQYFKDEWCVKNTSLFYLLCLVWCWSISGVKDKKWNESENQQFVQIQLIPQLWSVKQFSQNTKIYKRWTIKTNL